MPQLLAKFVPLVQTLILVGIDVRARSRFDRLTHRRTQRIFFFYYKLNSVSLYAGSLPARHQHKAP